MSNKLPIIILATVYIISLRIFFPAYLFFFQEILYFDLSHHQKALSNSVLNFLFIDYVKR